MIGFLIQFIEWTYYYFWKEHREIEPASSSETVDLSGSSQHHHLTSSNPQEDNIKKSQTGQMGDSKPKQAEAGPSNAPVVPPAPIPERVVLLYAFGALQPVLAIPEKKPVTKYSVCTSFNQSNDQTVYIFRDATLIHMFPGGGDSSVTIRPPGSYFVIFQREVELYQGLPAIKVQQMMMVEMMEYETKKGELRNPANYPYIAEVLTDLEKVINRNKIGDPKNSRPHPAYYKVGAKESSFRGLERTQKIIICALFGESIYQDVKIFYNGNHHQTLANCFDMVETTEPGKYVIIFESDSIHSLSNKEIEHELKNFELELAEQKKQQKKKVETPKETSVVPVEAEKSSADPGVEIRLYGYGDTHPKKILSERGPVTKEFFCTIFDQIRQQEVHVYRGTTRLRTFLVSDETRTVHLEYGSYIVIFQYKDDLTNLDSFLGLIEDMRMFEILKSDLHCEKTYPKASRFLQFMDNAANEWKSNPKLNQGFYGVGASLPMLQREETVSKMTLCIMFQQSICQDVKIFYNNRLFTSLSNCFEKARTLLPGKYVVVFESDPIYSMSANEAGNELQRIEQQLLVEEEEKQRKLLIEQKKKEKLMLEEEQKKKREEEESKKEAASATSSLVGEIRLFGFGDIKPTRILSQRGPVTKRFICSVFGEKVLSQEIQIYRGSILIHTFPTDEKGGDVILDYGTYRVVFPHNEKLCTDQKSIQLFIGLIDEMDKFQTQKGDIRCISTYPIISSMISSLEETWNHGHDPKTGFYGFGGSSPVLQGNGSLLKISLCVVFEQSIYQEVKVFYNNVLSFTASNCFDVICTLVPGKTVLVFESDPIYNMSATAAGEELQRIEQQLLVEEEEKQRQMLAEEGQKKKLLEEEQKIKKEEEESKKITATNNSSPVENEVRLYGYGDIKLTKILPSKSTVTKKALCSFFKQVLGQEVYIFQGPSRVHSFAAQDQNGSVSLDYGAYTVVFEQKDIDEKGLTYVDHYLRLMDEMAKFETQKGNLRCKETYRVMAITLAVLDEELEQSDNCPCAGFYGFEASTPMLPKADVLHKIILCAVFNQSAYQEIKIFHNNKFLKSVTNCLEIIEATLPGKYVVVFESDFIYSMPVADAENVLEQIELQCEKQGSGVVRINADQLGIISFYGYGDLKPTKTLSTKEYICSIFKEKVRQEVHLFRGPFPIHTFGRNATEEISLEVGTYVVVFQRDFKSLEQMQYVLVIMNDMVHFETKKGDLRNEKVYPAMGRLLRELKEQEEHLRTLNLPQPPTGIFGVGTSQPVFRGALGIMKIGLCALFNQTMYQEIKIFHNNKFLVAITNMFEQIPITRPGKYVVVFESDAIYSMSTAAAEKELELIEQTLLLEEEERQKKLLIEQKAVRQQKESMKKLEEEKQKKKRAEETSKKAAPVLHSEGVVRMYGMGQTQPRVVLPQMGTVRKRDLCRVFEESLSQKIVIYRETKHFHTIAERDEEATVFFGGGSYTIIFMQGVNMSHDIIEHFLTLQYEMEKFETQKGDLRCARTYPAINKDLEALEETSKSWDDCPTPYEAFYGVGDTRPVIQGATSVMKIILSAIFKQSISQHVKVFYKNKHHATLTNCFDSVFTEKRGKYVVVFESHPIYSMSEAAAEKELRRIEAELSKNGQSKPSVPVAPALPLDSKIILYGYGCLEPRFTFTIQDTIDKYILCIVFKQRLNQKVYIFNRNAPIYTFRADINEGLEIGAPGRYTVVFDNELHDEKETLEHAAKNLTYLDEILRCEKNKGVLRSMDYPFCFCLIDDIKNVSINYAARERPAVSVSRVGTREPTIYGFNYLSKMLICAYYNQSIYQDVKVFHNYRPLIILTNCFRFFDITKPGKYVVVFKTDAIYNKSDEEIGDELQRWDPDVIASKSVDEIAEEFRKMDEERKKKTEKNNKKKAKKKEKKLLQQQQEIDSKPSELGQQTSKSEAPTPDEPEAGRLGNDSAMQAPTTKKKKGKKQKKKSNTTGARTEELDQVSDSEEPAVSVENKFSSLQFLEKLLPKSDVLKSVEPVVAKKLTTIKQIEPSILEGPSESPIVDGNEATSSGFEECQDDIDDQLQKALAESVPFEKPKIYARNKNKSFSSEPSSKNDKITNFKAHPKQKSPSIDPEPSTSSASYADEATCSRSSYTQDGDSCTEDESSMFEEIPTRPLTDSHRGAKAVVVGILARGLVVQTLAPTEAESEFLLLDYCSQCTSPGRSLTDVGFDVKVLHVFLKVISVATLGNEPIVNENLTQKGRKIEKRVATYALDDDTWTRGRFKRGYRDSIDEELELIKKERKTIALIVETDEEDKVDIVRVVGPPSHLSFLAQLDKTRMRDEYSPLTQNIYFQREEFIMADSFQADPFFKLHIMFDTLCLVKSYQAEENFKQLAKKLQNMHLELQKCLRAEETNYDSILLKNFPHTSDPPNGDTFLFNIEKLDTKQGYLIETCCKELAMKAEKLKKKGKKKSSPNDVDEDYDPDELYNQFRLFLRDPALSICRFNSYYALRNAQLYTIKTKARLTIERAELCIVIELNHAQVLQVLPSHEKAVGRNKNSWIEGGQLKLVNPVLRRQRQTHFGMQMKSDADLVIDEIRQYREPVTYVGQNGEPFETTERRARIRLMPAKNSKDIFDVIQEFPSSAQDFAKEFSQIGPAARDGASETLATGLLKFDKFYNNEQFFNWWRGYRDADSPENIDYLNFLQEEIEIPNGRDPTKPFILDGSQSLAYQHAFYRDGITSIAAGPGSGKTLLSAGLIIKCHKDRMDERMIVTATTNEGVDNAVEKIVQLSPGFPATREMGKKGEMTIREEIKEHTLRYQALESEQTHPVLLKVRKEYRNVLKYFNAAKNLRDKLNRLELLHYAESKVKRTYLRTVVPFCGASTPALLVRHADHYNVVINDEDERTHRKWPIKHMIVDEASQLPYYTSLALCCSFPYLERITVMGDRKQLGPHCVLQSHSGLLSQLCRLSELDRINGLVTVEEFYLRMNYRSHLWIVENLEQPHYGPDFQSGLAPGARTLAYTLDLPLFKIRSKATVRPVAFINIAPGDDCQNASEREGVLKLLEKLMEKGASPAGISILCFHRKQKEELEKCLKPKSTSFKMRDFVSKLGDVHTIDSFQGRENDIIIVCTTKTVGDEGLFHRGIFSFVSDPRRGLVAVSRAKEAMYVFGQWKFLQKMSFWKDKVALIKREKLMYDESFNEM